MGEGGKQSKSDILLTHVEGGRKGCPEKLIQKVILDLSYKRKMK